MQHLARLLTRCGRRCAGIAVLVSLAVGATAAGAQAPLKNAGFDLRTLTRENFYATLEPIARKERPLVFYNTAGGFDAVWKEGLIPRFKARFGLDIVYRNVKQGPANQQLIAVHRARRDSPVDVYFAGNSEGFRVLSAAGVVAGVDLSRLLPNAVGVPGEFIDVVFGVATGGTWPLVHLNQTAIGYDSAGVDARELPRTFEGLRAWAEQHPGRFVMTSPAKGGSGAGFLFSAARHLTAGACRRKLYDTAMTDAQALDWAMTSPCLAPVWAYFGALLKVSELTNGNADTLNLINNRQALIGTVWEDQALGMKRAGQLPAGFRLTLLDSGQAASGDGMVLVANARSPASALLFIDMALGRDFQAWKLATHGSRSPRTDIDPAQGMGDTESARFMLPPAQHRALSVPVNWLAARALAKALDDKVLSQR